MKAQQDFAVVNGTRLYYEMAGPREPGARLEALVLVHGFTLDCRMWDDQFDPFSQCFRVLRYDARGHGRSALPEPDVAYTHVDDLRALMAHVGIHRAHVLGLSMGGAIAIDFALAYPEATASLIVLGSALAGFPAGPSGSPTAPAREAARSRGLDAAKATWLANPFFAPALEQPAVGERLRQMVSDYSGWHLLNANPERGFDPPAARRLGEIGVPTLVIVGSRDVPLMQAIASALATEIPNARKEVLSGIGHMINMEAPRQLNELVLAYLAGLAPASLTGDRAKR